jgi:uncharacterized protein YutE (UPF0331/DUF86 family)
MESEEVLRRKIVELLRGRQLTSEDLARELRAAGLLRNPLVFRKVLADLVREGEVLRVPSPERMKFVFTVRNQLKPSERSR